MQDDLVTSPTVISVDPGGTTGWSIMVVHPDSLVDDDVSVLDNIEYHVNGQIKSEGVVDGEWKTVDYLLDTVRHWPGAAVMFEHFIPRKNQSGGLEMLSPVRITAAFEYAILQEPELSLAVLDKQLPALAKTTATDDRLKNWGLYNRAGAQRHARDADRHCITLLRRVKKDPVLRHKSWPHLYKLNGTPRY